MLPSRSFSRPCTTTSYERGSVDATERTSSTVTDVRLASRRALRDGRRRPGDRLVTSTSYQGIRPGHNGCGYAVQPSVPSLAPTAPTKVAAGSEKPSFRDGPCANNCHGLSRNLSLHPGGLAESSDPALRLGGTVHAHRRAPGEHLCRR